MPTRTVHRISAAPVLTCTVLACLLLRIEYRNKLPAAGLVGDMRISYAKFLELLEAHRIKRVIVYGDMRTAVVEVPHAAYASVAGAHCTCRTTSNAASRRSMCRHALAARQASVPSLHSAAPADSTSAMQADLCRCPMCLLRPRPAPASAARQQQPNPPILASDSHTHPAPLPPPPGVPGTYPFAPNAQGEPADLLVPNPLALDDPSQWFAPEMPEWNMEKYRFYVDLPGDFWEGGRLMDYLRSRWGERGGTGLGLQQHGWQQRERQQCAAQQRAA